MDPSAVLPRALPEAGTIAFLSPSERLNDSFPAPLSRSKAALEKLGFRVKIFWTPEPSRPATISQSIANRIAELRAAFADPEVDAIICTFGGTTATELLPPLLSDANLTHVLRANPKIFVGYSDITTLHWALAARTGLRTFYGPTAIPELGTAPSPLPFSVQNLLRAITDAGRTPLGPLPRSATYAPDLPAYLQGGDAASVSPQVLAPSPGWKWLRGGSGVGPLFGGCLSVVVRLQGVRGMAPDWRGKIMFLETSMAEGASGRGFVPHKLRQAIADLAASGVFDEINGLVFGRFFGYDNDERRDEVERVVREALAIGEDGIVWGKTKKFPVLLHADFGHTSPMLTLPMGA
ncbi:peptidase u61 ld-carboxypeptidase a, partial [Phialemonium atrogriseum]